MVVEVIMKIQDELKNIAEHEVKSGYHKVRLIGAVGEKGFKILSDKISFLRRYVKEIRNDNTK